jgi:hypothetical protein
METKQLVTLSERQWIAKNAVRQLGSAITFPVIDVNKAIKKIHEDRAKDNLSPYVEIQPISPDMHKVPNKIATFQKDPVTGVLYGIALNQDDFGNIRWQKVQLHDSMSLNLDKSDDAKIWCVIRFHPELQGSPWEADNPYYKVYDPTDEALAEMGEIAAMRKAFGRVEMIEDKPKEMVLFARFLGEELMDNSNENIVIGTLLRFAKQSPVEFNRKWDSKIRSFGERFYSGIAVGIITQDADRGYMFRHISLGSSPEEAISFLSKDSNIMGSLNNDLDEKDILIRSIGAKKQLRDEQKIKTEKKGEKNKPSDPDPSTTDNKDPSAPEKVVVDPGDGDSEDWG